MRTNQVKQKRNFYEDNEIFKKDYLFLDRDGRAFELMIAYLRNER
jgi:hypothetical protein